MKIIQNPPRRRKIHTLHGRARYIDPDYATILDGIGIALDSDWENYKAGEVVSDDEQTQVYRIPVDQGSVFFKRYLPSATRPYRYFLRTSRCAGEWFGLHRFNQLGIPAAVVIGFGEDRSYGNLQYGYTITIGIDNSTDMSKFAHRWSRMPGVQKLDLLRDIRSQIFHWLHHAHRCHLFHRDLHWRNILIQTQQDGRYKVWFIDCPRAINRRIFWRHGQLVDLSALSRLALTFLSRTERYRSLKMFLAETGEEKKCRKLFREIEAHHKRHS